jgi:gas vesicle protein
MGQDPSEIRQGIEQTRGEMGETVEALGHKTDVTGRAKDAVSDRVQGVREKISGSTPDSGEVKEGAKRAAGIAQENPLGLAIGAAALGFVAGLLVPSTSIEDEKIGPVADDIKEKAKETGQEAMERGKEVARQAADTAQEAGRQQAEELRESSKQRTDDAREQAGSSV